jgi:hypothetical protein
MRVCVVGCGNQGMGGAALLARADEIDALGLLDKDAAAAERAVERVGSLCSDLGRPRPTAGQVDAADVGALAQVLRGYDMVINATMPAFNLPIMHACLEVGAHYLDLYSYSDGTPGVPDPETVGAQLRLHPTFEAAGLLALPTVGLNPGWSNIVAKILLDRFEAVDSVVLRAVDWFDSDVLLAPCDPVVLAEQWLGVPGANCTLDGKVVPLELVDTEERYAFLPPAGEHTILTVTTDNGTRMIAELSPVPIHHLEERFAVLSGGRSMKDIVLTLVARQTARHQASEDMMALFGSSFDMSTNSMHVGEAHTQGIIRDAAFAASLEVTGTRRGRVERHTAHCVASLDATLERIPWAPPGVLATMAVPTQLVLMLARGQVSERGVRLVAQLENAGVALQGLEACGMPVAEEMIVVAD